MSEGKESVFKTVPLTLRVLKFYPNFSIGKNGHLTLDQTRANPALTLMLNGDRKAKPVYLFAKYPDYHGTDESRGVRLVYELRQGGVKQFESLLGIQEGEGPEKEFALKVNSPVKYKGYRLYQSGYDEGRPGFSSIQISRDPSVRIMYAGFVLVMFTYFGVNYLLPGLHSYS